MKFQGNSAVLQSFVASISTNENRTTYLANLNMVGTLGYIVGPGTNLIQNLNNNSNWSCFSFC